MPSRNTNRKYEQNGIYHIYNRGINKQEIFLDKQDYSTFLFYLKLYLDNPQNIKEADLLQKKKHASRKNFFGDVSLLCYCLMPNHYHLVLKQNSDVEISQFMKAFVTTYSMYFNGKHGRLGPLFQGKYRSVSVRTDEYLLHLSRYIHTNPIAEVPDLGKLVTYQYSSYGNYLGIKKTAWLNAEIILDYFRKNKNELTQSQVNYQEFVEDKGFNSKEYLQDLILE